ncbi:hypothetical protein C900_05769 [Fulvivirga imtechensis AK7]|uniref:Uncharacterized protein n=1 Tax=Fulvivirga imtechensis AK7 TaxID=1237149 RepID=L8JZP0_9BACT|nr:hypothetical protein C900_05769 [Fulvivirga imtechensis AK7]
MNKDIEGADSSLQNIIKLLLIAVFIHLKGIFLSSQLPTPLGPQPL